MSRQIPNQFHFVFGLQKQQEPFHLVFYLCLESCIQINNPQQIFFYYHYQPYGKYWDLIKPKLTLVKVELPARLLNYRYQDRLVSKYRYAHYCDLIRLEKTVAAGGIYTDIDTIFVNRIPDKLYKKPFVLGKECDVYCQRTKKLRPSLCNAFIMSEKDSQFGHYWLKEFDNAFDGSWSNHACFLPQELSEKYPHLIHIEPSQSFYKHIWSREGIYTLLEGYDPDYSDVISMHLWNHLWWEKSRKDFSHFHSDRLTEDYIRSVDTTYNVIARRFLPEPEKNR
ncbi:MAG: glycosyltransferase, partial [Acidobacteriota bacterium]